MCVCACTCVCVCVCVRGGGGDVHCCGYYNNVHFLSPHSVLFTYSLYMPGLLKTDRMREAVSCDCYEMSSVYVHIILCIPTSLLQYLCMYLSIFVCVCTIILCMIVHFSLYISSCIYLCMYLVHLCMYVYLCMWTCCAVE